VLFASGANHLRTVAVKGGVMVSDEIDLLYQTEQWGKAAELRLVEKARKGHTVTVEAKCFDANGVLCLDVSKVVRFSLTGAGTLIDNLGTTRASRELQLSSGRAEISAICTEGCTLEARMGGLPPASLNL
jgi:beta-galactosidase